MLNQFSRTELLLGKDAMERLTNAKVAVFGIGGVGGYVCEALVRSGVGSFDLIDDDKVCLTNLNRQVIALRSTAAVFPLPAESRSSSRRLSSPRARASPGREGCRPFSRQVSKYCSACCRQLSSPRRFVSFVNTLISFSSL